MLLRPGQTVPQFYTLWSCWCFSKFVWVGRNLHRKRDKTRCSSGNASFFTACLETRDSCWFLWTFIGRDAIFYWPARRIWISVRQWGWQFTSYPFVRTHKHLVDSSVQRRQGWQTALRAVRALSARENWTISQPLEQPYCVGQKVWWKLPPVHRLQDA